MTDKEMTPNNQAVENTVEAEVVEKNEGSDEGQKQPEEAHTEEKQVEEKEDKAEESETRSYNRRFTKAELIAEMNDMKEDMEVLSAKIESKDSEIATLKAEIEKYKSEIQAHKETSEKYNKMIEEVIQEKKSNVPQEIQELLPEGLTVEQQLAWLTKAQNTGKQLKKEVPVVEIGKPMNMGVPHQDTANMTPHQKLSSYFATVFNK